MKVLVTGGAGFIGSHVVDALVARGDQVTVLDDLSSGYRRNVSPRVKFVKGSIVHAPTVRTVFRAARFQSIVHLAAQKNARHSVEKPIFDAQQNIVGSIQLLEAARAYSVKRFVFASTGGVMYGEAKRVPTPETEPVHPLSPYAIAKYSVENYLRYYHEVHDISTVALRLGNVFGPRQDPKGEAGVVAIFLEALLQGQRPVIFGSGQQTRDYIYVSDAVDAVLAAIDKTATGHYNIGAGKQTSVDQLYRQLEKITRSKRPARRGKGVPGEQQISALDAALAKKHLGWKPRVSLSEGLQKTYDWFRHTL